MSSFNDFCADAKRFAGKAAKKTGELAHCASLHLKLEGVKNKLCAKYEKLGRLTYKQLNRVNLWQRRFQRSYRILIRFASTRPTLRIR